MDGKFYPNIPEQELMDDVAQLERDSQELNQMKEYMGTAYPMFKRALEKCIGDQKGRVT
jgi:hypothetical protein